MFQPASLTKIAKKPKDKLDQLSHETGFHKLTIETIEYWNEQNIKNHQIKRSKILERLDKIIRGGLKTAPSLFEIEIIRETIDKYNRHLKTGFSKLSVGEGVVFKFPIDEFFKFSSYQRERIKNNHRMDVLKNKKSLFFSLYKNENEFFYPQKQARDEFKQMYSAIVENFNFLGVYEHELDWDLKKYSQINLQKCFDKNKDKLILCDDLVTDYEIAHPELFYTPELFYMWIMRHINDKYGRGFKIEHLNSKFFYSNFVKWMKSIGR